jgi:hypothetical protein
VFFLGLFEFNHEYKLVALSRCHNHKSPFHHLKSLNARRLRRTFSMQNLRRLQNLVNLGLVVADSNFIWSDPEQIFTSCTGRKVVASFVLESSKSEVCNRLTVAFKLGDETVIDHVAHQDGRWKF